KNHGPGETGGPPVELAIDEIGETAEEQPNRRCRGYRIRQMEKAQIVPAREERHRQDHADETAMERHAATPEGQDLKRVLQVESEIVKNDVAEPSAQHDTEHGPGYEVIQHDGGQRAFASPGQASRVAPADEYPDDIGQGVPADGDRTDLNQNRID